MRQSEDYREVGLADPMILARTLGHATGIWTIGLQGKLMLLVDGPQGRQELERPEAAGFSASWNMVRVVFERSS